MKIIQNMLDDIVKVILFTVKYLTKATLMVYKNTKES